jgi:hypothetical protein
MSDDQIAAAIVAKLDGPAEVADEPAEPAAAPVWPKLGQGERGKAVTTPPDPLLDAVLEQLGMPPQRPLGRGDR